MLYFLQVPLCSSTDITAPPLDVVLLVKSTNETVDFIVVASWNGFASGVHRDRSRLRMSALLRSCEPGLSRAFTHGWFTVHAVTLTTTMSRT
jgi:hypothetical protein